MSFGERKNNEALFERKKIENEIKIENDKEIK